MATSVTWRNHHTAGAVHVAHAGGRPRRRTATAARCRRGRDCGCCAQPRSCGSRRVSLATTDDGYNSPAGASRVAGPDGPGTDIGREMADDDREFLDFFADEFWSLRRVGFLLTDDWGEAEELAQEAMGPHIRGLVTGARLRPAGGLRPQGAAQSAPVAAAAGNRRGPPPARPPARGAPRAGLQRRRPGPVAGAAARVVPAGFRCPTIAVGSSPGGLE